MSSFDLSVTYVAIAFIGDWRAWRDEPYPEAEDLVAAEDGSEPEVITKGKDEKEEEA